MLWMVVSEQGRRGKESALLGWKKGRLKYVYMDGWIERPIDL